MNINGKCHCGKITFRASVTPEQVSICHCTDCQILTGSPYRVSAPAVNQTFELLTGEPKIYVKISDDGTKRAQAFCSDCGTPIYASGIEAPFSYNIRLGCIEQRASLPPQRRIWCRSALPWSENIQDLPKLETD